MIVFYSYILFVTLYFYQEYYYNYIFGTLDDMEWNASPFEILYHLEWNGSYFHSSV